jgi:hypothetical protein
MRIRSVIRDHETLYIVPVILLFQFFPLKTLSLVFKVVGLNPLIVSTSYIIILSSFYKKISVPFFYCMIFIDKHGNLSILFVSADD